MELHFQTFGDEHAEPLILMHGLLGSSRNWVTVSRLFAEKYRVFAVDLRNHGQSPHMEPMDYPTMVQDIIDWMAMREIRNAHFIGHSMGGKVLMKLASGHPNLIRKAVVADIAPKPYPPHYQDVFDAMRAVDPSLYTRITEVDEALKPYLDDEGTRQFVLTNLKRSEDRKFVWQVNLAAISNALPVLSANPLTEDEMYGGQMLFIAGAKSDFISAEDTPVIQQYFPNSQQITLENAGHNVHIDARQAFYESVDRFIQEG